jgi:DNA polymerase-3 subunit epsilon
VVINYLKCLTHSLVHLTIIHFTFGMKRFLKQEAPESSPKKARLEETDAPKYLFMDTETTGLGKTARLVEIAWIITDFMGKKLSSNRFIVKPDGFEIPEATTAIHGISTERALREGVPLKEVINQFQAAASVAKTLVCHNVEFDVQIVQGELMRACLPNFLFTMKKECTKKMGTKFCKLLTKSGKGFKPPRLQELYRFCFQTDFERAHSAFADTEACAKCFFFMRGLKYVDHSVPPKEEKSGLSEKEERIYLTRVLQHFTTG